MGAEAEAPVMKRPRKSSSSATRYVGYAAAECAANSSDVTRCLKRWSVHAGLSFCCGGADARGARRLLCVVRGRSVRGRSRKDGGWVSLEGVSVTLPPLVASARQPARLLLDTTTVLDAILVCADAPVYIVSGRARAMRVRLVEFD